MTAITSVNPATGQPIRSFDLHDDAAVNAALDAAAQAQRAWRFVPVGERVALLTRMAAAQGRCSAALHKSDPFDP